MPTARPSQVAHRTLPFGDADKTPLLEDPFPPHQNL